MVFCEDHADKYVRLSQSARPDVNDSAADLLPDPILATRARGTYVVRREHQRGPGGAGIVAGQ